MSNSFPVPFQKTPYRRIFKPGPAVYLGRDYPDVKYGGIYAEWVPNDHGFVFGKDGSCHIFGITHPLTPPERVHDGEEQLFHASAPAESLTDGRPFTDRGNLFPPETRPGENPYIHSPFLVEWDGRYRMVYGPQSFRTMESADLEHWTSGGTLFQDPDGSSRDPHLMFHGGEWFLTYCSGQAVKCRRSADFRHWSEPETLRSLEGIVCPESPSLFVRNEVFYLCICLWDGAEDFSSVEKSYQSRSLVYAATSPALLPESPVLCELAAHAPEFLIYEETWLISSAEYPERGISVAELGWKDSSESLYSSRVKT